MTRSRVAPEPKGSREEALELAKKLEALGLKSFMFDYSGRRVSLSFDELKRLLDR